VLSRGRVRDMTMAAVFAAILCVLAPWTIPAGPVPLSLATFAVYLTAAVLGWKWGTAAVLVYLLLGAAGAPVFSGLEGGLQKLAGVTGGYLVGYIPCALLTGLFADRFRGRAAVPLTALGMLLGTAVLYAVGTAWFQFSTGNGLAASLALCVLPFLPGDAVKVAAAAALAVPLRRAVAASG